MPPPREVEFFINLVPGPASISKTPYRMALVKRKRIENPTG